MQTWIALFRGINVGGKNILPMAELKEECTELKLKNPRTYIQSGNLIFESAAKKPTTLRKKILDAVETSHGFRPQLLLLQPDDIHAAVAANPFPKATDDPKTLHFFFLADQPADVNTEKIEAARAKTERWELIDSVFYLHAPDGIGRSKLAAGVEKFVGVAGTGRNYRTVEKLLSMI